MYIQSIKEIMFFCRFNGFLNNNQPNQTNFQQFPRKRPVPFIFIPYPKFGVANKGEPSENQPFNRNDPYNPDQEST